MPPPPAVVCSAPQLGLRVLLLLLLLLSYTPYGLAVVVSGAVASEVTGWFSDVAAMYELSVSGSASLNLTAGTNPSNIEALLAGSVDFAVVLTAMSEAQAAAHPNSTLLPIMATSLVPVYRLDALNSSVPLILSGRTLALIYAGNVTSWSDPLIKADNDGRVLPEQPITVCYQFDALTASFILTTALGKFEPSVAAILQPSFQPDWPLGRYAASLPSIQLQGMVSNVVATDGSIGVSNQLLASINYASIAAMINRAGSVVTASSDTASYTIHELLAAPTLSAVSDLTDPAGEHGWPIVAVAYLLLDDLAAPRGCAVRSAVVEYWQWFYSMSSEWNPIYAGLGLNSMPAVVQRTLNIPALLTSSLRCQGQPVAGSSAAALTSPSVPVYGATRLAHYFTTLVQFRTTSEPAGTVAAYPTFDFLPELSTAAMQLGQQSEALTLFYANEVANVTATPMNYTAFYLLPMFLTSIVVTFNPQLSETVNINGTELVIDYATIALILLQNVTDWHHPQLLALNPVLVTLLDDQPAPLTLVLGCSDNNPLLTAYMEALLLGLAAAGQPQLYASIAQLLFSPAAAYKFQNCLQEFDLIPIVYSPREDTIPALVYNTPGALGYGFGSAVTAGTRGVFAMLYTYTDSAGRVEQSVRRPTAEGLLACAEALDVELDTLALDTSAAPALSQPDCWPLTQVVYAQVPRAYSSDHRDSGMAALQLLQWTNNNSALDTWADNNLFVRTSQLPVLQSSILTALQSVTCDGDTLLVTLPVVWQVSGALVYSVTAVAGLGCIMTLLALYVVLLNRLHGVFRSASPLFMAVSLTGVMGAFVCATLLVATPSSRVCTAVNWTGQLAFTLVFSPLLAKTYRIYRIFGRQRLQVVRLTNRRLLAFVCALVALDVCMLAVWQAVAPMDASTTVRYSSNGQRVGETVYQQCSYSGKAQNFFVSEAIVKALLLMAGVLLAFSTRQVTDAFNESKSIGFAIYNIVLAIALIGPIILIIDAVGDTLALLVTFCLLWISGFTLCILFIPKLLAFYSSHRASQQTAAEDGSTSQSPYTFISLNQLATAIAVQQYLAAIEQHTSEIKKRLSTMKRLEQGFTTARGSGAERSRTTASRGPDTGRASTVNTARGSIRSVADSNSTDLRGSITLVGLANWKKQNQVAPSKSSSGTPTPQFKRQGSVTNSLPPLRLPVAAAEMERVERPDYVVTDSPLLPSTGSLAMNGSGGGDRVNDWLTPDSRPSPLGFRGSLAVCEVNEVVQPAASGSGEVRRLSMHRAPSSSSEVEELNKSPPPLRLLPLPLVPVVGSAGAMEEPAAAVQRNVAEAGFG